MTQLDALNDIQKTIAVSRRHIDNAHKKIQDAEAKMTILITILEARQR